MSSRKVKFKPGKSIHECPKCGNNIEFTIHSDYCAEDCCEIWAVCKCGFDPTQEDTGYRLEDVWGGVGDDNCINAIEISWNEGIEEWKKKRTTINQ